MPVIIEFSKSSQPGEPPPPRQEFGPFRVVEVSDEQVAVFDGFQPFTLATKVTPGKWQVNGLEGMEWDYFIVLPPREQAAAELEALTAVDDE
jgi:hypothetical protein